MGLGPGWVRRGAQGPFDEERALPPAPDASGTATLEALAMQIANCTGCERAHGRARPLAGRGPANAAVMVVDLVPTTDEARAGEALTSSAGRLFEQMLFSIGHKRADVYVTHELRCDGGTPSAPERALCSTYLQREIELLAPRVIVVIGKDRAERAAQLGQERPCQILDMPHPAELLNDAGQKRRAWSSLVALRAALARTDAP